MEFNELSPEQQAKVDACVNAEELLELAKQEGIELSEEQLDSIAGGWRSKVHACPKCGSTDVSKIGYKETASLHCNSCQHTWF